LKSLKQEIKDEQARRKAKEKATIKNIKVFTSRDLTPLSYGRAHKYVRKNRFFYSTTQARRGNSCSVYNKNTKQWVRYSEWISESFEEATCNWEDAILVYETDDDKVQIK